MQVATVTVVGSEMKKVRKFPGLLQITWSFFFGLGLVCSTLELERLCRQHENMKMLSASITTPMGNDRTVASHASRLIKVCRSANVGRNQVLIQPQNRLAVKTKPHFPSVSCSRLSFF